MLVPPTDSEVTTDPPSEAPVGAGTVSPRTRPLPAEEVSAMNPRLERQARGASAAPSIARSSRTLRRWGGFSRASLAPAALVLAAASILVWFASRGRGPNPFTFAVTRTGAAPAFMATEAAENRFTTRRVAATPTGVSITVEPLAALEARAVEALASGQRGLAQTLYEELARQTPNSPIYAEISRVLSNPATANSNP